jgi:transglutaminase-like putative cysteine protease
VFGNQASRFEISQPYSTLSITAESLVELSNIDPFAFAMLPIRPSSFPLGWMPWERTMLAPYLMPSELPDTQLREIYDYAMQFVERNGRDLMETLFAINLELFNEYAYVPGSTSLATSPYDVMRTRTGVCQDFANLFICMARLLNIPARYACGYLYTGNTAVSRAQSDSSHAWVQLYIPDIGWKSFDPTNGVLPSIDHVHVAVGRHFRDTAPTAGTFYGYAREKMSIDVSVIDESTIVAPA